MDVSIEKVKKIHAKIHKFDDVADFDNLMDQFKTKLATYAPESDEYKVMVAWKDFDGTKKNLLPLLG